MLPNLFTLQYGGLIGLILLVEIGGGVAIYFYRAEVKDPPSWFFPIHKSVGTRVRLTSKLIFLWWFLIGGQGVKQKWKHCWSVQRAVFVFVTCFWNMSVESLNRKMFMLKCE